MINQHYFPPLSLLHENERDLNDSHNDACSRHLSCIIITPKVVPTSFFWPTLFFGCIHVVKYFYNCYLFAPKEWEPLALLHLVLISSMVCKCVIGFMDCKPMSTRGHKYIVVPIDYFTKSTKTMLKYNNIVSTITHFLKPHSHSI